MPREDTAHYTKTPQRQAEHIVAAYEQRGVLEAEAERCAWATVNAMTGGGKQSGTGRSQQSNRVVLLLCSAFVRRALRLRAENSPDP